MEPEPLHIFSRSDIEQDWECPRSTYWRRVFGERGLDTAGSDYDLTFGTILHAATHKLLTNKDLDPRNVAQRAGELLEAECRSQGAPQWLTQVQADPEVWFRERHTLIRGMILGWYKVILPQLTSMGALFGVEHEVTLTEGDLCMMTQPDVLIEPHDSEELVYVEWKTTKQASPGWFMHWTTAPQFMAAALAVQQTLNKTVGLYQVIGLLKGDWKDGWQHSPFCWGWRYLQNNGSYDYAWEWESARRKGWERFQIPESMIEWWVENMPQQTLIKQFPQTLPLPIAEYQTEAFRRQMFIREKQISDAKEFLAFSELTPADKQEALDGIFPQHFSHCNPVFGRACWAHELCWQPVVAMDPIGSGRYVWRVSHHEMERKRQDVRGGWE